MVVMVCYWRLLWHSGGGVEVVTMVVTGFVTMAVVLVVGVP